MKRVLHVVLVAQFLTGCATFQVNGVDVYDRQAEHTATHNELRLLVQEALHSADHRQVLGWDFVFSSAWFAQMASNGTVVVADGLTVVEDEVMFLKVHDCFAHSAIFHELGHVELYKKYGDGDKEHKRKEFWRNIKSVETRFIKRHCPPDYDPDNVKPPTEFEVRN